MSVLSIDEAFSFPQASNIESERLKVRVKCERSSQTVAELKKAIVRKGYPSLCDASRITLLVPQGPGLLLRDDMLVSTVPLGASILALVSSSSRDTQVLQADAGLNIPHILYVYHANGLKAFLKLPHSLMRPDAGNWITWNTNWSVTAPELCNQFVTLGFNSQLIAKEVNRMKQRRLPDPLASFAPDAAGHLAPSLMIRLWDAAGLSRLASSQKQAALRQRGAAAPSEFEVFSACSSISVEGLHISDSTLRSISDSSRSTARHASDLSQTVPSVVMASPSEHESAYDETFYESFFPPTPTVQGSDCSSESDRTEPRPSHMDWTLGSSSSSSHHLAVSNKLSRMIKKVGELTKQRDQLVAECQRVQAVGDGDSQEIAKLLEERTQQYEAERLRLTAQLEDLTVANRVLRAEVDTEVQVAKELFETVDRLKDEQTRAATEATVAALREIEQNLAPVVTCPICCERYGSRSNNSDRRPIHLSCGHIFCASCLHQDWTNRVAMGLEPQARCFNRCANFDLDRLGEIYLLDDVKDVLDRLPPSDES